MEGVVLILASRGCVVTSKGVHSRPVSLRVARITTSVSFWNFILDLHFIEDIVILFHFVPGLLVDITFPPFYQKETVLFICF